MNDKKKGTNQAPEPKVKETKSSKIRKMYTDGTPIGDIAKTLNIRYEFAYQVSKRFAKDQGKEFTTNRKQGETKASKIKKLLDEGKKPSEIADIVDSRQPYVYSVAKEYKQSKAS